jgi:epoxyqueuosine reductase QueG
MANIQNRSELKKKIIRKARQLGADLIGFASINQWQEHQDVKPEFYPQHLFSFTKTVIVLGVPILSPMLDTTPSIVYSELYNTTNRLLDDIAYQLSVYLNKQTYRTVFFPRDAYGDISILVKKPEAAFSHVIAGKYAGIGTIGYNHTLLTKEYGPRVRLVSIFTDAEITPDNLIEKELCIKCELCGKCCPTSAFTTTENLIANMDKFKCAEYHAQLKNEYHYPCGVCIKVCPIGKDRKLYGNNSIKYLNEKNELNQDPSANKYSDWVHIRSFGSKSKNK